MKNIEFRRLKAADAANLSELLSSAPAKYIRYFTPFPFDSASLSKRLKEAERDIFMGLELHSEGDPELAGFYMLRGFDEGYLDPMYGVYIAAKHSLEGLATLTLAHAEAFCKVNHIQNLLLKVHPENLPAKQLYESNGFIFLREDKTNDNLVLTKSFGKTSKSSPQ